MREYFYVENSQGGDVTVVDIASGQTVDTIAIGHHPDDVISDKAGKYLYLSVHHEHAEGPNFDVPISDPGEVVCVDAQTHQVSWRLPVSGAPDHLILSADDQLLFQPIFDADYIEIIDVEARRSIAKAPVGLGSHGTRLSPDGNRVYVGCMLSDEITVIDTRTFKVEATILFPEGVRPFAMTSDEQRLFVQLSRLHGFVEVDLTTHEIVRRIDLPNPEQVSAQKEFPHTFNHGLNITSDDRLLFAAGSTGHYVCVYELPDLKLVAQIPTGKEPNWVIFNKEESLAFISCRASDEISVISVTDLVEISRWKVGDYPQRMTTVLKEG
jgi:YVTN family beta-propeller protein